ncbi:DUF6220 domain-containing protein [Spongiactinospora sp. TRM90649]|uniref:DUF6220 domain-containing protein n=1 Tax=Spongiactinospora sp. TRM90649 TaxID=3031114 RepID=UPI0023F74EFF|nr:DUF6220 domain-containing protein [Spongiactinospora sp. TRM90649]MDF5755915.1 DUF6220 domain-containing protein [Spongiactinospora sp. TRM90649]
MRKAFLALATLQLVAVIAQFYFATFGAFQRPIPAGGSMGALEPHVINGTMIIPLLGLVVTVVAAIARAGGRMIWWSVTPVLVVIAQLFVVFPVAELFGFTAEQTTTGAHVAMGFHAILGLVLLLASVRAFQGARALASGAAQAPAATAPQAHAETH